MRENVFLVHESEESATPVAVPDKWRTAMPRTRPTRIRPRHCVPAPPPAAPSRAARRPRGPLEGSDPRGERVGHDELVQNDAGGRVPAPERIREAQRDRVARATTHVRIGERGIVRGQ